MQAIKLSLADLLKIEGNMEHYHIPKYQREYVWGKYHWETLFNDITENGPDYFIGSVIVVSHSSDLRPGEERIYQVIDGQQRLTTLSIFLNAIYYRYNELLEDINDDDTKMEVSIKLDSIRKKLIKKKDSILPNEVGSFKNDNKFCFLRVQPSTQNNNLSDYKFILNDNGILKNIEAPKFYGLRRFWKAYEYFYEHIPTSKEDLDILLDKINRLVFIHISVGTQSDAFTLFETLNNRGVDLSPIDIIKNSLLAEMEKQHQEDIDTSYDSWQKLLGFIPDFDNQLRFLRQYYNAFKVESEIKQERISRATKSNVLQIYEKLIKKNAKFTFKELLEKGELYSKLIGVTEGKSDIMNSKIIELNRVGASASYTFLMYLLAKEDNLSDNTRFEDILDFIIKYYVRRNVTDTPNTRDLDAVNIEVVENCEKIIAVGKKITMNAIIEFHLNNTKAKPANLSNFEGWLSDIIYINNVGMTRYLLWKLDSMNHTKEYSPNLWQRNPNNGTFVWTIEHILPEGNNIPKSWTDMIANGDKELAKEIQSKYAHLFGNLTLSAYNSNLSNRAFKDKQNLSTRKVGNEELKIGYKNGLSLNNLSFNVNNKETNLANIERWTKESIESRTNKMVKKLLEIFKFDNE